jgi:hypothetical protein
MEEKCYAAWRRSEAYAVPVTSEGERLAMERYKEFKKGYYAGVNAAAAKAEQMHKENKHVHKFFLLASNAIRGLLNG